MAKFFLSIVARWACLYRAASCRNEEHGDVSCLLCHESSTGGKLSCGSGVMFAQGPREFKGGTLCLVQFVAFSLCSCAVKIVVPNCGSDRGHDLAANLAVDKVAE